MESTIIALMGLPAVKKINFTLGGAKINAHAFDEVAIAVATGGIKVEYHPKLGTGVAFYIPKRNALALGYQQIPNNWAVEALLLHECVHAWMDMETYRLTTEQSEAAAYIAQVLYAYYLNPAKYIAGSARPFDHPVTMAAWDLAIPKASRPFTVSEAELRPLYAAIGNVPMYRDKMHDEVPYDGI